MRVGDAHERLFVHDQKRYAIEIQHAKLGTFTATVHDAPFKVATVTGQTADEAFNRMVSLIVAQV